MAEIIHEFHINSDAASLYAMLTAEDLLSEWWLKGAKIAAEVGAIGTFPPSDGKNQIVLRLLQLVPNKKVVWQCLEHKFSEWTDTKISFEISQEVSGTALRFKHSGWKDSSGVFGKTSFYWAALYLRNLKEILEADTAAGD